jgi:hypothetical protein
VHLSNFRFHQLSAPTLFFAAIQPLLLAQSSQSAGTAVESASAGANKPFLWTDYAPHGQTEPIKLLARAMQPEYQKYVDSLPKLVSGELKNFLKQSTDPDLHAFVHKAGRDYIEQAIADRESAAIYLCRTPADLQLLRESLPKRIAAHLISLRYPEARYTPDGVIQEIDRPDRYTRQPLMIAKTAWEQELQKQILEQVSLVPPEQTEFWRRNDRLRGATRQITGPGMKPIPAHTVRMRIFVTPVTVKGTSLFVSWSAAKALQAVTDKKALKVEEDPVGTQLDHLARRDEIFSFTFLSQEYVPQAPFAQRDP